MYASMELHTFSCGKCAEPSPIFYLKLCGFKYEYEAILVKHLPQLQIL
jgi:hypothetical protein